MRIQIAHAAALSVGAAVLWDGMHEDIFPGTVGEVLEIQEDGSRRVQFPAVTDVFAPESLVLATREQVTEQIASQKRRGIIA